MANSALRRAKGAKRDEFYTLLEDVERELDHYREHFEGKTIYLNCDNAEFSAFWQYFIYNFDLFGLKKLIATHYEPDGSSSYKYVYEKKNDTSEPKVVRTKLNGDGDFRSEECIELLKEADVVATNPPFSLWREYIAQLIEYDKKFIIMGNQNAMSYKEIFPLIKDGVIWLGNTTNKTMWFSVPEDYELKEGNYKVEFGQYLVKVPAISWYTNFEINKHHEELVLTEFYEGDEEYYPKYDNYGAIEVGRTKDIPMDYTGVMGVPITYLNNYNPDQFDILGMAKTPICHDNDPEAKRTKIYENATQHSKNGKTSSGGGANSGLNGAPALLLNNPPKNKTYYTADNIEGYLIALYARILIVNKKPVSRKELLRS